MDPREDDDRRVIFEALERVHGPEVARRMMARMPPFAWEGLATKADLAALREYLEARMDERFDRMDERFDRMDERFDRMERTGDDRFARVDERIDRLPTHADLAAVEHRIVAAFRGELVAAVTSQTRMLLIGLLGTALTFGALLVAGLQLG